MKRRLHRRPVPRSSAKRVIITTTSVIMDSATYYGPGGAFVANASRSSASPGPSSSVARRHCFVVSHGKCSAALFSLDTGGGLCLKEKDARGAYLLDRCPTYVEPILEYLQNGRLLLNDKVSYLGVIEEAKFFGVDELIPDIQRLMRERSYTMTRQDVIRALCHTCIIRRCELSGVDLSRLDLRHVDFRGANLSMCNLEHADLSHSDFEGAQLYGAKMMHANLEGADLRSCKMGGPGRPVNLERRPQLGQPEGRHHGRKRVVWRQLSLRHADQSQPAELRPPARCSGQCRCLGLQAERERHERRRPEALTTSTSFFVLQHDGSQRDAFFVQ
ncbi:hypothetical protein MTO96_030528 [Rhipicephalus appendiculatus]